MSKKPPYWGNELEKLMDLKDMSIGDLATEAGVTTKAVRLWLNKDYPTLPAKKAARVSEIFDVPYYKIFPLVTGDED